MVELAITLSRDKYKELTLWNLSSDHMLVPEVTAATLMLMIHMAAETNEIKRINLSCVNRPIKR